MRYSIMLQLITSITLVLLGTAALFAWLQNRPYPARREFEEFSQAILPQ